ncbi:DUF317 domain-containing protein [Streptomyces silvisoli]|uniref:DUF317 domain-containing protein n=1 Tax=Streptomyces silvisoli TaxID=3034235 RepID=A0ABT5ZRF1_9ACTN|nr:DUF317 domain-containing protein [Streptomyces silvisoli]MDF3292393.1 DUF317 domain-containing protein [Streptomyces silvisoli]
MSAFAPNDRVLISPRHLAGGGIDRLSDVIGPLIHLFDWQQRHDAATGHIVLDSPDRSVQLDVNSAESGGAWWHITHHDPYWAVEFTRQTPIEAVAAVARSLPQLLGDQRHADGIPLTSRTLTEIAVLNNWTVSPDGSTFASRDEHCTLRHMPEAEVAWSAQHSVHDESDTQWNVSFTRDAPEVLVAQFFTHLSTHTPVERTYRDIPRLVRDMDEALITPVRGAAVNPRVHHVAAQIGRIHSARRR